MPIKSLVDVPAPGKLNLFLHVLGRRPDGYHLLQSAFVLIDWCDSLHFELRSDGQLLRHDLNTLLPLQDLCLRAAHALKLASGCALGCDISVNKQLPSGAGMGGGSSDAATVLLALNRLWGLNWTRRQLQKIALPLGADVPFFIGGNNAWVEGIGETLTPLMLRRHLLAVVKPDCHVDTSRVFSSPNLVRQNEAAILPGFVARGDFSETGEDQHPTNDARAENVVGNLRGGSGITSTDELFNGIGRNDLQQVVETEFLEVAQASSLLLSFFGNSRMTGSGSAVFATLGGPLKLDQGVQERAEEASRWEAQGNLFQRKLPANWTFRMCQSLTHHPLRNWVLDDEGAN